MKLEKAIEILHLVTDTPPSGASQDCVDAVKLGFEAMKAYAQARRLGLPLRCGLLPGETE